MKYFPKAYSEPKHIWQAFYFLTYIIAPISFSTLLLASCYLDPTSAVFRLSLYSFFLVCSIFNPKLSLSLIILVAPWLTVPTLQLGLQNQFIFESMIIAWITSYIPKKYIDLKEGKIHSSKIYSLFHHPFILPMIFAILFTLICSSISIFDIFSLSKKEFSLLAFLKSFITNIFLWNRESPFHGLSIIFSYLIYLICFLNILSEKKRLNLRLKELCTICCLSSLPIYFTSIGQWLFPYIFSQEFTVDKGGLFQNGNLLSFYSGIIILLSCYLCLKSKICSRMFFFSTCTFIISLLPLYLGGGRTAWISLTVSILILIIIYSQKTKLNSDENKFCIDLNILRILFRIMFLVSLTFIAFLYCFQLYDPSLDFNQYIKNQTNEFYDFIFSLVLLDSNRYKHYLSALESLKENYLTGIGLGNYAIHNDGKEIHNLILQWAVEMSIFTCVPMTISIILFINKVRIFSLRNIHYSLFASLFSLFIFFSTFTDHYFTSREITFIVGLIFLILVLDSPHKVKIKSSTPKFYLALTMLLAASSACSTFFNPHSLPQLKKSYKTEISNGIEFNWNGPVNSLNFPDNAICQNFKIYPSTNSRSLTVFFHKQCKNSNKLKNKYKIRNFISFIKNKSKDMQSITLSNKKWTNICVCKTNKSNQEKCPINNIELYSNFAIYPSWAKNTAFNNDLRFISYATSVSENIHSNSQNSHECTHKIIF